MGQGTGIYIEMGEEEIEALFPYLSRIGYSITSPKAEEYNCIAWAAGDTESWWEPDAMNIWYWPSDAPREYTLEAYKKAYEIVGFKECDGAHYEKGFEKVAIYTDTEGRPTHAARQLESGLWTSKLGRIEDIEHNNLESLNGSDYGSVKIIMKRPIT